MSAWKTNLSGISTPAISILAKAVQAIKLSVSVQQNKQPFWQARYYDFNVWSSTKVYEKLEYMHRNPVKRGLVAEPAEWAWSSFRHYATGEQRAVEVESDWTAAKRNRAGH